MKHKRFDRQNWQRTVSGVQTVHILPDGVLADYRAGEVTKPLDVPLGHQTLRILGSGYRWVYYAPHGAQHALTVMLDSGGGWVQLYVDIALESGLDLDGIPYITDLYLDVAATLRPDGLPDQMALLDEDEWADVQASGELRPEHAALAWAEAQAVMAALRAGTFKPLEVIRAYLAGAASTPAPTPRLPA